MQKYTQPRKIFLESKYELLFLPKLAVFVSLRIRGKISIFLKSIFPISDRFCEGPATASTFFLIRTVKTKNFYYHCCMYLLMHNLTEDIFYYIQEHPGITKAQILTLFGLEDLTVKQTLDSLDFLINNNLIITSSFHMYLDLHQNIKLILEHYPEKSFKELLTLLKDDSALADILQTIFDR